MRSRLVHEALVYGSEEELLAVVIPFLADGIAAGEPTLLGVEPGQRELLLDALGDRSGVTVLDADQYSRPQAAIRLNHDLYSRYVAEGATRVRVVGTVPAADATWPGWSRYEAAMNHVVGHLPVWAICLYDRRETSVAVLADVERTHTHLRRPGPPFANPSLTDPATFLAERARTERDPLEDGPPNLELHAPSPSFARQGVVVLAGTTSLARTTVEHLGLAVYEVVMNAVQHGRPPVELRAWLAADRVVVAVSDAGPGPADPYVGLIPGTATHPDALGLHLAYQSCSLMTLERAGNRFTVRLVARDP